MSSILSCRASHIAASCALLFISPFFDATLAFQLPIGGNQDQSLSVDIYSNGDGNSLETDPTLVIVDVLADVDNRIGNAWTAGGLRGVALSGATFGYAWYTDPNNPSITYPL